MALDPSIPYQVRPIQLDNPMDIQAKGLQLRQLYRQNSQADQAETERKTLSDLYRSNVDPTTGAVNHQGVVQGLAQAGMGDKIPAYVKSVADMEGSQATLAHTRASTAETELTTHKRRLDILNGGLSSLLANPNVTHDDVINQINNFVNQGLITPEQGAEAARNTPGRPEQLRPFLVQKAMEAQDASKQLEAVMPKYNEQDTGGEINQGTIDPLTGVRTAGVNVPKTVTPGEKLNADNIRAVGAVTYQQDAHGNIVAVPTRPGAGPIQATPVTGPGGAPLQGKGGGLNDTQSKALLYGARMRAGNKIMDKLSAGGTNIPSLTKGAAERVPLLGGALGAAANSMVASPEEQQLEQAQRDFVNAALRRESGAAISPSEFDSARKQYFPSVGDSKAVIAQKKANRELAVRGMMSEVPEAQRDSLDTPDAPPPAAGIPSATGPNGEVIYFRNGKWGA